MPLFDCPECMKRISDSATACPHCGYPVKEMTEELIDDSPTAQVPIRKVGAPIWVRLVQVLGLGSLIAVSLTIALMATDRALWPHLRFLAWLGGTILFGVGGVALLVVCRRTGVRMRHLLDRENPDRELLEIALCSLFFFVCCLCGLLTSR